jgi:putative ABC transport system substrate-binding protein
MDRRAFITVVGGSILPVRRAVEAQQTAKVYRVGWLSGGFAAQSGSLGAFRDALRDGGFVVGQNVILDLLRPEHGTAAEYANLAAQLIARSPSVILGANPNSLEALTKATTSIPIVGVDLESDPVAKGWVVSLARPGRNLTGFFLDIPEMSGKQLQMVQEIRPTMTRVAVLGDPRINELQFRATEAVAGRLGVTLHALSVTEAKQIPGLVTEAARQKAGALVALTSPLVNSNMKPLAVAALTHKLPTVSGFAPSFAEAGGLLAYGPDFPDLFRRAAGHVLEILKGARPGDLPVQRPTKFPLVININTAKALGLTIPQTLLLRADQVIQ